MDCAAAEQALVDRGYKTFITSLKSHSVPGGFERIPSRADAPAIAKFYLNHYDQIPFNLEVELECQDDYIGYPCRHITVAIQLIENIDLSVAPWDAPRQLFKIPFKRERGDQLMLETFKDHLCDSLHLIKSQVDFFIAPRENAVLVNDPYDVLTLRPQDVLLWRSKFPSDSVPIIEMADLKEIGTQPIGTGTLADVFSAKCAGGNVVFKKLRLPKRLGDDKTKEALIKEAQTLWSIGKQTDNICRLIAVVKEPLALVMDYAPHGTLFDLIHIQKKNPAKKIKLQIALDVASALQHLHNMRPSRVCAELQSSNVMLFDGYRAKLGDFGATRAAAAQAGLRAVANSTEWTAPEFLANNNQLNTKSDVYSFGMLLYDSPAGSIFSSPFDPYRSHVTV